MGVHLYCLVPAGIVPAIGLPGIDGVPVVALEAGALSCWASEHEHRPEPSTERVRAHAAIIAAAMTRVVTPVPLRFGQWFADRDEGVCRIAEHEPRWQELLRRFAGHAEYGVVIATATAPSTARDVHPSRPTTGKAYMEELARKAAETARLRDASGSAAEWLARRVGPLAAGTHAETAARDGTLRIAHLVAWRDVSAYRSVLRAARAERSDVRLATTGPWPPYSFVTEASA